MTDDPAKPPGEPEMTWVTHDSSHEAIVAEIEQQTDRGAALIAVAFVANRLERLIKSRLDPNANPDDLGKVFQGQGPLASFSAQIDLGYLMQFYPPVIRTLLHMVRDIRNDFAHTETPIKFDSQSIGDRCKNILKLLPPASVDGPQHIKNLEYEFGYPEKGRLWYGTFATHGDIVTPRQIYMAAITRLLLHLSLAMDVYGQPQLRVALPELPDRSALLRTPRVRDPNRGRRTRRRPRESSPA
jgi:hypothetical protein